MDTSTAHTIYTTITDALPAGYLRAAPRAHHTHRRADARGGGGRRTRPLPAAPRPHCLSRRFPHAHRYAYAAYPSGGVFAVFTTLRHAAFVVGDIISAEQLAFIIRRDRFLHTTFYHGTQHRLNRELRIAAYWHTLPLRLPTCL